MFGEDPYEEHKERMEGNEGNHRGTQEKTLNQHEYDHTCARSKKHKEIHGPNPTKDDTSGGSSSPRGGLESMVDLLRRGRGLSRGGDPYG